MNREAGTSTAKNRYISSKASVILGLEGLKLKKVPNPLVRHIQSRSRIRQFSKTKDLKKNTSCGSRNV